MEGQWWGRSQFIHSGVIECLPLARHWTGCLAGYEGDCLEPVLLGVTVTVQTTTSPNTPSFPYLKEMKVNLHWGWRGLAPVNSADITGGRSRSGEEGAAVILILGTTFSKDQLGTSSPVPFPPTRFGLRTARRGLEVSARRHHLLLIPSCPVQTSPPLWSLPGNSRSRPQHPEFPPLPGRLWDIPVRRARPTEALSAPVGDPRRGGGGGTPDAPRLTAAGAGGGEAAFSARPPTCGAARRPEKREAT